MNRDRPQLAATGIAGLDDVLTGGLTAERVYLLEGDPGSGKTTLALQFLMEGVRAGEPVLYVTLSETKTELLEVGRSHGWSLEGVNICELAASEDSLHADMQLTMYHPSEVELSETTKAVLTEVERLKPRRVVFDSLSEMRLLAQSPLRYRRQILALKQFFIGRQCTVFLLDDRTSDTGDLQLASLAHGVMTLEQLAPEYGAERRRLRVTKMRGRKFRGGYHDFVIKTGGIEVFPRLIAAEHHADFSRDKLSSGVAELDTLVGGGLPRGTSTLLLGPAGTGKSSLAARYVLAAAERGEPAVAYLFEEGLGTFLARSAELGMDFVPHVKAGRVKLRQIDPAELSPGEFAHDIRRSVEQDGVRVVLIDSLNGYLQSMPDERHLVVQLHELLTYLGQHGVVSLLVVAQHGIVGQAVASPVDATYLADSVLLLRHFESAGRVRKAVSVLKKRSGGHESTIRELEVGPDTIRVGQALVGFQGVLTGIPRFVGAGRELMEERDA